jgi:hypothetical protein
MSSLRRRLTATLLAVMMFAGCAARQTGPIQPGPSGYPQPTGFNQFSIEQEIQIGRQAAAEADAQLPILPADNPITDYVDSLGIRLAENLPEPDFPYDFKVVNQKEINAFALPGGPIRINVGTVTAADNEAELAGVLAHEIAHVYMRHATRNASKQMAAQIPAAILGGLLGQGIGGQLARLGLQLGLGSAFLKYSRDAESEADYVGAKLMYEAGYDPRGMVSFFEELQAQGGSSGPEFLASHPNPGNRAASVGEAIRNLPPKQYGTHSAPFQQAKAEAAKLKPLTAQQVAQAAQQRQGRVENVNIGSIAPSRSFQRLDHSAFRIAYPQNWRVYGDQNSAVLIAPEAGVSQQAIAYGVLISGMQPRNPGQGLERSTADIYQMIRQSNPEVRASGGVQQTSFNGMRAMVLNLVGPSPLTSQNSQRVAERNMLVAIQRPDGMVLWLLFIAPEPHFDDLSPAFQQMLNSLQL